MTSKAVRFIGEHCKCLHTFALTYFPRDAELSETFLRTIHKESDIVSMLCARSKTLDYLELEFYGHGKEIMLMLTAEYIYFQSLVLRFIGTVREED